jgi:hypothetical protein
LVEEPKAVMAADVPLEGLFAETPGAHLRKSNMLNRRTGVFSTTSDAKLAETPDFFVSTIGLSPVTVTVSATELSFMPTLRSVVPPTETRMPSSL